MGFWYQASTRIFVCVEVVEVVPVLLRRGGRRGSGVDGGRKGTRCGLLRGGGVGEVVLVVGGRAPGVGCCVRVVVRGGEVVLVVG